MRQEMYDDPHQAFEAIKDSIRECGRIMGRETVVVGLGGIESLVSTMAASEVFGPHRVLAVNAHSIFSDSRMPTILQSSIRTMPISFCTVDVTRSLQEILNTHIGLCRIETERMHFTMDQWQKTEMMAYIRNAMARGVAIRHGSIYIESYSLSKIVGGWVLPTTFDWNPIHKCTRRQISIIASRRCDDGDDLLSLESGLDLWPDGGPRPPSGGLDIDAVDPEPSKKPEVTGYQRVGLGIWQPGE